MSGVVLSSSALSQGVASAQELIQIVGDTFGSNIPWFFLVATLGAILAIIYRIMRGLATLGK